MFLELSGSRPSGDSIGPIPQSEYLAWFLTYKVDGLDERARHQRMVSAIDRVFVEYTEKKRKAKFDEMKRSGGKGGGTRRLG